MQTRITPIAFLLVTILSYQACFAGGNNNARSQEGVLDSILKWNWDGGNSSYDQLVSGTWLTYDANNNNITWLYKNYSGGNWTNYYLHTNTFDNNNNLTLYLNQIWSGSAWTNSQQTTYTYDGSHNQLTQVVQNWVSGAWANNAQTINHYNGNLVESAILQSWVGGAWSTTDSFTYTYSGNNLMNETDYSWSAGAWVANQQWVYTYTAGNKASVLNQQWTGAAWANQQKDVYTYSNNELVGDLSSIYNGNLQITSGNLIYGYDANSNNTSIITQTEQANTLVNQDSAHLYYHETTSGINNIVPLNALISVYPNPSKYMISVAYHSADVTPVMATLYDITGRLVIAQPIVNGVQQIDVQKLSSGVYQMAFTNDKGGREVKRVVIE